jgi:curved DNA-binding protein CbpA
LGIDPYQDWLGIPPEQTPPDHYALLGLTRFESDPAIIRQAASEPTRLVRARGLRSPDEATRLLNAISHARLCLLDPVARGEYDQTLRASDPVEPELIDEPTRPFPSLVEPNSLPDFLPKPINAMASAEDLERSAQYRDDNFASYDSYDERANPETGPDARWR